MQTLLGRLRTWSLALQENRNGNVAIIFALSLLPIFGLIQRLGNVSRAEMDRTFNNGLGMIAIVSSRAADPVVEHLRRRKRTAWIIGEVRRGKREAIIS